MGWIFLLGLAVAFTAFAALTGIKPKGTRHVSNTRLMGIARVILLFLAVVLLVFAYRDCNAASRADGTVQSATQEVCV